MSDSLVFAILPSLLLFSVNWKIELCFTLPVLILGQIGMQHASFAGENGNMDCFDVPAEEYINQQSSRWLTALIVFGIALHSNRKTELTLFLEQELTRMQQQCLQNIFDAQDDGIVILSKKIASVES